MFFRDRRLSTRHALGYQIMIHKGIMISDGVQLARILDAGSTGMRLFLAGVPPLPVGAELNLECTPARKKSDGKKWYPVNIPCKIVWRDVKNYSYGIVFS